MTQNNTNFQIRRGSSVLMDQRSSQSSVQSSAFEFLSQRNGDSVIAVTCEQSPDTFLQKWHDQTGTIPSFARVITVGESMRSTQTQVSSQNVVRPIKSLDDLTAVQLEIASALQDAPEGTVFILDSLTPFFEQVTRDEILSFVETVVEYIVTTKAIGYFSIDTSAHNETTITALRSRLGLLIERDEMGWLIRSSQDWISGEESLDVLFDILRSRRRREILRHLLTEETTSLSELATVVAKRETQEKVIADGTLQRYLLNLSQIHIPKLVDEGYILYDSDTQSVSSCEATQRAKPFLVFAEQ